MTQPYRNAAALLVLLAASLTLRAADSGAADGDMVLLNPFEVQTDKDTGYIASDTLSGGRLQTNLLKTPNDISVLTKDFLDDIGTFNIADAEPYLTNSSPAAPAAGGLSFGADVSFRGLPSSTNTRNYFNAGTASVAQYVVDRIEGQRGANSILYGPSLIGGGVNTLTKRAQFHDFGDLGFRVDAFGSKSATLDVNRAVGKTFAIRVNAVDQDQKSWVAGFYDKTDGADVTTTWRPWHGAELRVEGEYTYRKTQTVQNSLTDSASYWNGTAVTAPLTGAAPAGSGISKITTDYLVYSPSWGTILNLNGYGKSTGSGLTILNNLSQRPASGSIINFPVIAQKGFRDQPPDTYIAMRNHVFEADFDQELPGGGMAEVAMFRLDDPADYRYLNFGTAYVDVNKTLPGGAANPEFGNYYSEVGAGNYGPYNQYRTDYRGAVTYPIKTPWFTQNIGFIADQWTQTFDPILYALGRDDNASTPKINTAANQIEFRRYWDGNPNASLGLLEVPGMGYNLAQIPTRETYSYSTLHGYSVNTSGSYFHDTLNLIGGIRRDFWMASDREINSNTVAASGAPTGFTYTNARALITTRSIGGTYFPVSWVGAYAGYQQGFNPAIPSYPTLTGQLIASVTGDRGRNAGLRFRLLDGRIVASVGYYDANEANRTQAVSSTQINDIWTRLATLPGQSALINNKLANGAYADYLDTYNYRGKGYEADVTANVTSELRMMFNLGVPQATQSSTDPYTIAYYNANIAQWKTLATGLSAADQTSINTDLATIQGVISNATDGRTLNGNYKWRANAFAVYQFHTGPLKDLRVGAGANLFGEQQIGSPTGAPYTYIYSPAYEIATALVGYRVKVAGESIDVQLNVNNVFNYTQPIYSSITTLNGVNYKNAYYYAAPRNFVVSARLHF